MSVFRDTAEDVTDSYRVGVRVHLMALVAIFAITTSALMGFAAFQSQQLRLLTEQLNQSGSLRMLSQHSALLVQLVARDVDKAQSELDQDIAAFDTTLTALRQIDKPAADPAESATLDTIKVHWTELRNLLQTLSRHHQDLSTEERVLLHTSADRTLHAAQDLVNLLLPRVNSLQSLIHALVPINLVMGAMLIAGMVLLVQRRILHPVQRIEALMKRLAAGDLAARGEVHYNDELGRLMACTNQMAQTLEYDAARERQTLEELKDSETRHRTLWEMSADAIVTIDRNNTIVFANPAVITMFGYQPQELLGQSIAIIQPVRLRPTHVHGMQRYLEQKTRSFNWSSIETQALHKDGREIQVELTYNDMRLTNTRLFVGTFRDITERKSQQAALMQSVSYDSLTGLPNRFLLHDHIELAIANAKRHRTSFGLLFLDLDNFKIINDTLGHEAGDQLLCYAAQRLLTCVRDGDTVARVGGDEFVLLLSEVASSEDIDRVAQRALDVMAKSFSLPGGEGYVGVSIGASVYPDDAQSRVDLLQHADIAMYRAKDFGRNNYQRYDVSMQARFKWRMSMEVQLRQAIETGEFVLYYQPQIDLVSGQVVGAEALIRWNNPDQGRISPAQFIPLAEETGLIVPIGKWVVKQACKDATTWIHTPEGKRCVVAINLSPRQFNETDLYDSVATTIAECDMAPHHVEFEITEGLVMGNPDYAAGVLRQLRALGCSVALDDFGTGYSSLASLRTFPMDCLKIDKSLICDLAIVRAVIQLARSFGFKTLAEGVEDADTLSMLRNLGCDMIQGYYFAKPMPLAEFQSFLRQHAAAHPIA